MKFITVPIIFLTFTQIFNYKLAVFGDPGEIDAFRKFEIGSNTFRPLVGTIAGDLAAKAKIDDFANLSSNCKFNNDEIAVEGSMKNWEGVLTNLKDKISAADTTVILGDMVYPEAKKMSTKGDKWNEPSDLPEADRRAYWEKRRNCGWRVISNIIAKFKNLSNVNQFYDATGKKINSKLSLIPGNHLYDVSPKWEVELMAKLVNPLQGSEWLDATGPITSGDWDRAVSVTTVVDSEATIYFIDFNSALFELVVGCTATDAKCKNKIDANIADSFIMGRRAIVNGKPAEILAEDIYNAVEGLFKSIAAGIVRAVNKVAYIVLRAHHPPFNVEGDLIGILNYISYTSGKTFLEACKDAATSLMFTSHHHSAEIWAFPYSQIDATKTATKKADTDDCHKKRKASTRQSLHTMMKNVRQQLL